MCHFTDLKLKRLFMAGCPISDASMDVVCSMPSLESLSVEWCVVTDAGFRRANGELLTV
jgi:hypothetical protein